jgi:prepilin-type N-terminal cleavage/methylation domain-containing protein
MRFRSKIAGSAGFTLVEIIVTLVIMGIMVLFFINFMGTAQTESWKSVELVAGEAAAEAKIEEIIAYFTSKINSDPENALSVVMGSDFGSDVVKEYITFDNSGNEIVLTSGTSQNLKITVEAPGNNLSTVLTKSRSGAGDPIVNY